VWHRGLITKLRSYGFKGDILSWLKDYISQRSQSVINRNFISNSKFVNAGVPQGSVLGPFLFLMFINDLADDLHSISRLFADDTSLSYSSTLQNKIENVLNNDLQTLHY